MPLVVVDPIVLVNAVELPDGPSAKLLTLLAYGWTTQYLQAGIHTEDEAVDHRVDDAARARVLARHRALEQSIPSEGRGVNDVCRAGSALLRDAAMSRAGRLRYARDARVDTDAVAEAAERYVTRWDPGTDQQVPDYTKTGDRDANVSIHAALRTGAELVITTSLAACPLGVLRTYELDREAGEAGEASLVTAAVPFDNAVRKFSESFDFHAIDSEAFRRLRRDER